MLLGTAAAYGQAVPTALRNSTLEAGGQFTLVKPDYGYNTMYGLGGVVDVNGRKWVGAEAEIDYTFLHALATTKESTYLIGPRILWAHERWTPYAKVLIGFGHTTLPNPGDISGTYLTYSFGGGVDWRYKRSITIRVIDAEYQIWPGFGSPNPIYRPGSLTPFILSAGVKYRFFQNSLIR